jgi:flagellar hook-basal body complex protein FliE
MQPFAPINGINQQLSPIQSLTQQGTSGISSEPQDSKLSFSNIMATQLMGANSVMNESGEMTSKLITGQIKNPHDVAISGQKAGIMLKLTTTICSKVSSACTTLFQMQI